MLTTTNWLITTEHGTDIYVHCEIRGEIMRSTSEAVQDWGRRKLSWEAIRHTRTLTKKYAHTETTHVVIMILTNSNI